MTTNVQTFSGDIDVSSNLTVGGTLNTTEFGVDLVNVVFPVGTIFISNVNTNPQTYLNDTTWVAYGQGQIIVSLDSGDSDFDAPGKTGGAKTHTLTEAELPTHVHDIKQFSGYNQTNGVWLSFLTGQYSALPIRRGNLQANYYRATGTVGDGSAHDIMQPYVVNYMWLRTA
jgi:hypothetical protein